MWEFDLASKCLESSRIESIIIFEFQNQEKLHVLGEQDGFGAILSPGARVDFLDSSQSQT